MKYAIVHNWSLKVLFEDDFDFREDHTDAQKLGMAVALAVEKGVDLSGAQLAGADLSDANLRYAKLEYADLTGADISGADLNYAILDSAILKRANLRDTLLVYARLVEADLTDAIVLNADFAYTDLSDADLSGVQFNAVSNLEGVRMDFACQGGTTIEGRPFTKTPITVEGFPYNVTIFDDSAQIGCEFRTIEEWLTSEDERFEPYKAAFEAIVEAAKRLPEGWKEKKKLQLKRRFLDGGF